MALGRLVPELYCTDFDRTLSFFTQALGFDVLFQRPEDRFAYLSRGRRRDYDRRIGIGP